MTPSTELPRDFCAGIGPLQLGVLLVFYIIYNLQVRVKHVELAQGYTEELFNTYNGSTTMTFHILNVLGGHAKDGRCV